MTSRHESLTHTGTGQEPSGSWPVPVADGPAPDYFLGIVTAAVVAEPPTWAGFDAVTVTVRRLPRPDVVRPGAGAGPRTTAAPGRALRSPLSKCLG